MKCHEYKSSDRTTRYGNVVEYEIIAFDPSSASITTLIAVMMLLSSFASLHVVMGLEPF